jgi:hypothetical protein
MGTSLFQSTQGTPPGSSLLTTIELSGSSVGAKQALEDSQ